MPKTEFDFEVIVSDDCSIDSNDKTSNVFLS
jgi:hypothetical protein